MQQRSSAPEAAAVREHRAGLVDSMFYLAASVAGRAAQLLALPLLVRMLSPAEFGRFDLALVCVTLVATALLMGTDSGVAPDYARCGRDDLQAIHSIFLASCRVPLVLCTAGCAALAAVQLLGLIPGNWLVAVWLITVSALLASLLSCLVGLLRWTARAKLAATVTAVSGIVPLSSALLAAWALPQPTFVQMLTGFTLGSGLAVATAAALSRPVFRDMGNVKPAYGTAFLIKRSWAMGAASLASPTRRSVERVLILTLLGESALAAYAVLARLAQILEILLQALGNGLYPRALRLLDDEAGKQLALRAIRLHWSAGTAGVLVFTVAASPLLDLMGGSTFSGMPYLLPMAGASACLAALPFSAGMAYFHVQRIALYAAMLTLTGLASLLLAWAGAWTTHSLAGWVGGMLAGSALLSFVFVWVSERLHPVGYRSGSSLVAIMALVTIACLPYFVTG